VYATGEHEVRGEINRGSSRTYEQIENEKNRRGQTKKRQKSHEKGGERIMNAGHGGGGPDLNLRLSWSKKKRTAIVST